MQVGTQAMQQSQGVHPEPNSLLGERLTTMLPRELLVRGPVLPFLTVEQSQGTYQAIGDRMPQNLETGYKATISRVLQRFSLTQSCCWCFY